MAERVPGIRLPFRDRKACQCDDGGGSVGKVVQGIRHDCKRTAEKTSQSFSGKQKQVQYDTNRPAEHSPGIALFILTHAALDEEARKQAYHNVKIPFQSRTEIVLFSGHRTSQERD